VERLTQRIWIAALLVLAALITGCKSNGAPSATPLDDHSGIQLESRIQLGSILEVHVEERASLLADSKLTWRTVGGPLKNKDQLQRFEQAVRTADIMKGQPKAAAPDFQLTAICQEGQTPLAVSVWNGGMLEVNDIYCTLTEDGLKVLMKLIQDARTSTNG
jgi:hypothetical protein